MSIKITLDTKPLDTALQKLERQMTDLTPAMEEIGD
jgi:phage-related minor tail protein